MLPAQLPIPLSGPVRGRLRIPGSKSITNRALLVAGLAQGTSRLEGVLHSDDTRHMITALGHLGAKINPQGDQLVVQGLAGRLLPYDQEIYVENAGTAARFLTAALALGQGSYVLNGNQRMQERPIQDLIQALGQLGVMVQDLKGTGCPPVKIQAGGLPGGKVRLPGDKSSQYLSAMMLAAPYAQADLELEIQGHLVSRTYVEMTAQLMQDFGAKLSWLDPHRLLVQGGQGYQGRDYWIEGDASSASYFFALAAITGGSMTLEGLEPNSTQGDLGLLRILERMGCQVTWGHRAVTIQGGPLQAVEVDMNSMSDVAPTLAVVALFAPGRTRILNVGNMRIKECDRISALVTELTKLGAVCEEWEDGLAVEGGASLKPAELDTYDDHRMAMCLSLAGLKQPGVVINHPACVSKTYPDFFDHFLPLLSPP